MRSALSMGPQCAGNGITAGVRALVPTTAVTLLVSVHYAIAALVQTRSLKQCCAILAGAASVTWKGLLKRHWTWPDCKTLCILATLHFENFHANAEPEYL